MVELILAAEEKKNSGTSIARALRKEGKLPAIIYGFNQNNAISLVYKEFLKEYCKGSLLSKLVKINIGSTSMIVIPRDIQTDPISDDPIHVDFQLVKDNIPITVNIKVKVVNQDKSPGIERGGVLNIVKKYVKINCVPNNIPEHLEIDILGFEIGKNIHTNEIKLPDGVTYVDKHNSTILTITGKVEEKDENQEKNLDEHSDNIKDKKEEDK